MAGALKINLKIAVWVAAGIVLAFEPVHANRAAIIPAYALVSESATSIRRYQHFMDAQNRVAAKKLLATEAVFLSPRDVKVEIVTVDAKLVKVKLRRLDNNARPITLYFWALADQLKFIPEK